jgi:HEAT repeat protein
LSVPKDGWYGSPIMRALPTSRCAWPTLALVALLAGPPLATAQAQEEKPPVEEDATPAVGVAGNIKAVELLTDRLETSDSFKVRAQAAVLLGRLGDKKCVPVLVKALVYDEHFVVRAAAATALGTLGDERGVEPLFVAAAEPEPLVRDACARALTRLDARSNYDAISRYAKEGTVEQRSVAVGRLGDLARTGDEKATEIVVEGLADERPVRDAAAAALADIPTDRAVPILIGALNHEEGVVRAEAARLLGPRQDVRAVHALATAYDRAGEQERVRAEIRRALERLRPLVNMDTVAKDARSAPDKQLRARAIRLLGVVGDPRSASIMEELLEDQDPFIVGMSALALADLGSVSSTPKLEEALKASKDTRAAAPVELALKKLRRQRELQR